MAKRDKHALAEEAAIDYSSLELSAEDFAVVGTDIKSSMASVRKSMSYWRDAVRRLRQDRVAVTAITILAIIILGSIFCPLFSSFTYREQFWDDIELPFFSPSSAPGHEGDIHIFGTDQLGRDLWTRVWSGGRVSLFIGLMAVITEFLIGVPYGAIAGFVGGRVDSIMMRIVEIINGIPYMIIVTLLLVVMPPGIETIIIALAIVGWTGLARLVRGQVVALKEQEYVMAAKTLGASRFRLIFRHMFPNTLSVIIVALTTAVPGAIFTEAFLSFIGLGMRPPMASWGSMCEESRSAIFTTPSLLFVPAIFISVTMVALYFFGDALRNVLDPKLRK